MTNPQTELQDKKISEVFKNFVKTLEHDPILFAKLNELYRDITVVAEEQLTTAADTARADERARMLIIIENRRNMIFSCGYGDCDDSVSAELFEIEQALQQDTKE